MELKNKFVSIKGHVDGAPSESDFEIRTESIDMVSVKSGEVIVKTVYVSVDPYQLNRMKTHSSSQAAISFAAAITPAHAIDAYGIGRVVASSRDDLAKDDLVIGMLSWGEYTTVEEGRLLNKLEDPMGLPLPYYVGSLGFSGLTAYGGFFQVCKPKKGERVFVSAACGSVGSLVGQYAKLYGCHVVGSAGTQLKVDLLKQKLGFDDAFNYKDETNLKSTLKRYFPEGIDIYFDNVGGEMLEAVVANMNTYGRVAICGAMSQYIGDDDPRTKLNMLEVVFKRITMQGFLAADYLKCYPDFFSTTVEYLRSGKMESLSNIACGLESVPSAFVGLFRGDNIGKTIVQIADE